MGKRRDQMNENGGSHSDSEWETILALFENMCANCGSHLNLTKDHIIPVSKGGRDDIYNIQPLCFSCNASKNNRFTTDYRDSFYRRIPRLGIKLNNSGTDEYFISRVRLTLRTRSNQADRSYENYLFCKHLFWDWPITKEQSEFIDKEAWEWVNS